MTHDPTASQLAPLTKRVEVQRTVEEAFDIFTARIGDWWPLAQHSITQDRAAACAVEPREGGELYETDSDGARHPWGRVLTWEPPHRLVFTWHPGRDSDSAQEVEVTFEAAGEGTLVVLEHRDWHKLGDAAEKTRQGYDTGWDFVLGQCFAGDAGKA